MAPQPRGPKTKYTDAELLEQIRTFVAASLPSGEGHGQTRARLGVHRNRTTKPRLLRLMRDNKRREPQQQLAPVAEKPRAGSFVTGAPDPMRDTDGTATVNLPNGLLRVSAGVDDFTAEWAGIHTVNPATRLEALRPLRQGMRDHFCTFGPPSAAGWRIRHDRGSQYVGDHPRNELRFLGMESSPAFAGKREGNGCLERFFRTFKGQLLWGWRFGNLDELR